MLLPVESILTGTWGGDDLPAEFIDFELMQGMGWTFAQLKETPDYVQRYCFDFINMRRAAENKASEDAAPPRG